VRGLPPFLGERERQGFFSASGAVLGRGEAPGGGRSLLLLLKGRGLLRVSCPGVERSRRRGLGGLEPLVFGRFTCYRSPRRIILREAEPLEPFLSLRARLDPLRTALRWAADLSRRVPEGHPFDEALGLLYWSLQGLARGVPPEAADVRYAWRMLRLLGRAPDLLRCGRCGRALSEATWGEEGLLCADCAPPGGRASPEEEAESLSPLRLRLLREIAMLSKDRFIEWAAAFPFPEGIGSWARQLRSYHEEPR